MDNDSWWQEQQRNQAAFEQEQRDLLKYGEEVYARTHDPAVRHAYSGGHPSDDWPMWRLALVPIGIIAGAAVLVLLVGALIALLG